MKNATLVIFGDSYTAGRLPHTETDGAFAAALGGRVVADHALSGSTAVEWSMDIGDRLTNVCIAVANVAVGSLGGNDAFAAIADGRITAGEALSALSALTITLYRIARSMPVVLMLYPDPWQGADAVKAVAVARMNEAIRTVAQTINGTTEGGPILLLDLGVVLLPEHFDGVDIHPNVAGYAAMAQAVMDLIDRM